MKRSEPNTHTAVSKELKEFFLERSSTDEDLDAQDTMLTNPASSPYYPANQDPGFNFQSYIKNPQKS